LHYKDTRAVNLVTNSSIKEAFVKLNGIFITCCVWIILLVEGLVVGIYLELPTQYVCQQLVAKEKLVRYMTATDLPAPFISAGLDDALVIT